MYFLIVGALMFFAVHFYSAFRSRLPGNDTRKKLGDARFMATYSVISLIGFVLMVWGYDLARPSPQLYNPPAWARSAPYILMLPAFILIVSAYAPRGRIKNYAKHPMLWATILWSFSHLLANGEINSLILFGGFLVFALIDRISVINRPEPIKKISKTSDIFVVLIGAIAYAATLTIFHPVLFGVSV
ncbi:MAG: NnrU family protein [Hyphomonadaceae bacterium]|nr:NnrU family protein [Hyphomonadaceae bacterium]